MSHRWSIPVALLAACAPALAQEGATRTAQPLASEGGTISISDYPEESLKRDEQGMATAEYVVDENGRVRAGSCRITASSGHRRLDERTCAVIERRFRFEPALLNGKAVPETRTQSIFWRLPGEVPSYQMGDIAIRRALNLGLCLLAKDRALAFRIVGAAAGSPAQVAAAREFDGARLGCWARGDKITTPPLLLAASIAEHAVKARFVLGQPVALKPAEASPPPRNGTEGLGQCIVRRNPVAAQAVLGATPTSTDEAVAIGRILPDLSPCVMEGTTLRLNRLSVRSLVAIGLYREAQDAR